MPPNANSFWANCRRVQHGTLPRAALVAFPVGFLCGFLKWYEVRKNALSEEEIEEWNVRAPGYTAFTGLLAFLIVFRSSQAYDRFWNGTCLAQEMVGNFFDAASGIVSFTLSSKADAGRITEFKQTMIALTSLLSTVCFCEMAQLEPSSDKKLGQLEVLGWHNFDARTKSAVQTVEDKVRLVFFWWQCFASQAANEGILNVPPPILSRVFAQAGAGLHNFEQASQLSTTPFPLHYTHATVWLLVMHMVFTPLEVLTWTKRPTLAFLFSFVIVFVFWALYFISTVLEHPFGEDEADIDISQIHQRSNQGLKLLLTPQASRTAVFSENRKEGRGDMAVSPGTCVFGAGFCRNWSAVSSDDSEGLLEGL